MRCCARRKSTQTDQNEIRGQLGKELFPGKAGRISTRADDDRRSLPKRIPCHDLN
jgi:hypothetical protein